MSNDNQMKIFATRSFVAGVKKLHKAHKNQILDELYVTVIKLANFEITKQKSNHPLHHAQGHKDLHLAGGDLILIYRYDYDNDLLIVSLRLHDLVNHTQLASYPKKKYNAPVKEYDISNIKTSTALDSTYAQFIRWYGSLPEEYQWEVDDLADSEALPFYADCSDLDLLWLMDHVDERIV